MLNNDHVKDLETRFQRFAKTEEDLPSQDIGQILRTLAETRISALNESHRSRSPDSKAIDALLKEGAEESPYKAILHIEARDRTFEWPVGTELAENASEILPPETITELYSMAKAAAGYNLRLHPAAGLMPDRDIRVSRYLAILIRSEIAAVKRRIAREDQRAQDRIRSRNDQMLQRLGQAVREGRPHGLGGWSLTDLQDSPDASITNVQAGQQQHAPPPPGMGPPGMGLPGVGPLGLGPPGMGLASVGSNPPPSYASAIALNPRPDQFVTPPNRIPPPPRPIPTRGRLARENRRRRAPSSPF
ncbi:hypothetical protein BT63DRAFT_411962 [Microthyrium microscopicum]|uniref:Uncharacterized protein n=1 Tax=Microthyrium microscopicum TaxID=703497 RepID=A0A6A6UJ12_9PEZI|nr:hypothetical protein BT63DRAFT_411962 [Microthyrium microscopicum]